MSEGATILIAEDDADVLRAARIALMPCVGRIETLASVEGLDAALASASFDVVLLDMNFVSGERSGGDGQGSPLKPAAVGRFRQPQLP